MVDGNSSPETGGPPVGDLEMVPIGKVKPNPRNPRQTFDPRTIERLAASLESIGLQVPITVYKESGTYFLLDGERRFRAATLVNWPTVPALVVPKPSANENAVRMFNIHMLREEWREIETCWALEQIMEETGVQNDRDLQKLTGLSVDRIRNMKRVLAFPRAMQEKVSRGELPYQFLVELDKNILTKQRDQIKGDDPAIDMSVAQVRDVFIKKYQDGVESDIVDLRKVGTLIDTAKSEGKVAERAKAALQSLVSNPIAKIEDAYDVGAASSVELSKVIRDMLSLPGRIEDLLDSNLDDDQRAKVREALDELRDRVGVILKKVRRA